MGWATITLGLYLKELEYRFNRRELDQEDFTKHLLRVLLREPHES